MPVQAIGIRAARKRVAGHLGPHHHLAPVAARHCAHRGCAGPLIARIACGACWERAIRDDEQVVIEHGLARDPGVDEDFVDEVAVRLALRGACVELTPRERAEVERVAGRQQYNLEAGAAA